MIDKLISNQEKLLYLQKAIEDKTRENKKLVQREKDINFQTNRYEQFFNKVYLSIWEEDPSKVYKILDLLPFNSGNELAVYLTEHRDITLKLLKNLVFITINNYTVSLFSAKSKTEFMKALNEGRIFSEETIPAFYMIFSAMMEGKSYCEDEIITYTLEGKRLHLLMTAYIPGKGNGNILISMMDISDRKHREESLENTVKKAEAQNKTNELLQAIILTLSSSLDKSEILSSILTEVNKIIPYSCADIRLIEDDCLRVAASTGYEDFNALDFISNNSIEVDQFGDAEKYLKTGKIQILEDTYKYQGWRIFKETSFVRSYIGLPIIWNGKTLGILSLNSDRTGTYSRADSEPLKLFAYAAAIALQNSEIYAQTKKENQKRLKIESSIKKSLKEKKILLREIHHRVKNNLSLIISLINLQSNLVSNDIDSLIFENLKQRIYTISLVHEKLYNSENLTNIDFKSYITDLVQSIKNANIFNNNIDIQIDLNESIGIEPDILIPLGLLVNEILFNSVKHAFPGRPGIINVSADINDDNCRIVLKDNGIGMPEKHETSSKLSGLDLVETLISQIDGTINFSNNHGTISTIIFPLKQN